MNSIKPKNVLNSGGSLKMEKRDESLINKEEASDSIDDSNNVLRNFELNVKINKAISKHLSLNRKNLLQNASSTLTETSLASEKKTCITDSSSMIVERHKKVFKKENHFYPKVANARMHPLVASFFKLSNESIIARYKQLNPAVNVDMLRQLLAYTPKYFKWAGKQATQKKSYSIFYPAYFVKF